MTAEQALQAISARINGTWDDPALLAFGSLLPDPLADVSRIIAEYHFAQMPDDADLAEYNATLAR